MSDMYGHKISKGELHLRGNYLKVARSKNILWKKFELKILFVDQYSNPLELALCRFCFYVNFQKNG